MPDCARFMRSGENEVEGITPNFEIPNDNIKTVEFVEKLKTLFVAKNCRARNPNLFCKPVHLN